MPPSGTPQPHRGSNSDTPRPYAPEDYVHVRDQAVAVGRLAQVLTIDQLKGAIAHGARAQAFGPILDPTLARNAGTELDTQLRFLHAVLVFRREIEAIIGEARDAA